MTAPKKPVATDTVPIILIQAEQSLLRSFRAMDDRSQGFIGRLADAQAEACPRRAQPSLRIVKGGKS